MSRTYSKRDKKRQLQKLVRKYPSYEKSYTSVENCCRKFIESMNRRQK